MIIKKELKNSTFEYDEEKKSFVIKGQNNQFIELNKVYAFAFMRFVVRMAQRNWFRGAKAPNKVKQEEVSTIDEIENPNQLKMFESKL